MRIDGTIVTERRLGNGGSPPDAVIQLVMSSIAAAENLQCPDWMRRIKSCSGISQHEIAPCIVLTTQNFFPQPDRSGPTTPTPTSGFIIENRFYQE
jgi:hypothetical protein